MMQGDPVEAVNSSKSVASEADQAVEREFETELTERVLSLDAPDVGEISEDARDEASDNEGPEIEGPMFSDAVDAAETEHASDDGVFDLTEIDMAEPVELDVALEAVHDAVWMRTETSTSEDEVSDPVLADPALADADLTEPALAEADPAELLPSTLSDEPATPEAADSSESSSEIEEASAERENAAASPNLDSALAAMEALALRVAATEQRNDELLSKIRHAIGVVGQRIDAMEDRIAAPAPQPAELPEAPLFSQPEMPHGYTMPLDPLLTPEPEANESGVAPYIANAEREIRAKREAKPLDIFDRIAAAAETEFDNSREASVSVIEEVNSGRRVGTRKWSPSKVKKRMEALEKVSAETQSAAKPTPAGTFSIGAAQKTADTAADAPSASAAALSSAQTAPDTDGAASMSEPLSEPAEGQDAMDDSALSVVPGARGRRRERARKSRLDDDLENVFEEEGGANPMKSLRRKLRDAPVDGVPQPAEGEAAQVASTPKSGILSKLIGKKKPAADELAPSALPVEAPDLAIPQTEFAADPGFDAVPDFDDDLDDADLMSAFDDEFADDESRKPASSKKRLAVLAGGAVAAAAGAGWFFLNG